MLAAMSNTDLPPGPQQEPDRPPPPREPIFNPQAFDALPVLVLALTMIAIQCWIAVFGLRTQYSLYDQYAFFSLRFWEGRDLTALISHAFLHGGWTHLLMNMFAMYALGAVCWRKMGTVNFYAFFAITAAAGAIAFALIRPGEEGPLVGASGAIFGMLAGFKYLQLARIAERGYDVRRDAIMFLLQITVLNFILGLATGGMMAWEAHFGGLAVGWFITPWLTKKENQTR